jgi:hypothetical protein
MALPERLLEYARTLPEGAPLRAKELLHLGSREAVDQAMTRLARSGDLSRISRGVYLLPVKGRFGVKAPPLSTLLKALSSATGEVFAAHGAAAANALGLSTQVPMKPVYLTSGRSRRLKVGGQVLDLRHAPEWQLLLPDERVGDALRALSWSGREEAGSVLKQLRGKLTPSDRDTLLTLRGRLPSWLAQEISGLAHG